MASIRLRGKVYQARWNVPVINPDGTVGVRREERSTGQRDKKLAREVARRFELESIALANGPPALRVDVALAQYLAHLEALRRSSETLEFYRKKGLHLMRVFGAETDVHKLGPADVTRYMHKRLTEGVRGRKEGGSESVAASDPGARRVTPHTVSKELAALRAVLRWHGSQRRYRGQTDWCVPGELRGAYKPGERALSQAEYHALHEALSADRRDYLEIFVGCGTRDSELYRIEARDILASQERLHIRGRKTDGSDRWVPLRPELLALLKRRAARTRTGSLFPTWTNVRRDLHAGCKRAKIPPVSPNDLRRTFASWHAEAGTPELVVVQLMGHRSSAMVRRVYARIGSQAQSDAAARFPALRKEKRKTSKKAAKKKPARKAKKR